MAGVRAAGDGVVLGDRTPEYPPPTRVIVTGGASSTSSSAGRFAYATDGRLLPAGVVAVVWWWAADLALAVPVECRGLRPPLTLGGWSRYAGDSGSLAWLSLRSCRSVASNLDLGRGRGKGQRRLGAFVSSSPSPGGKGGITDSARARART